jgi:hypothetical protein
MKKPRIHLVTLLAILVLVGLPAASVSSEIRYGARISPQGISNMADHFRHFGGPRFVHELRKDGQTFYEFTGFTPTIPVGLALPASEPAYIYHGRGRFVTWNRDPGDNKTPWSDVPRKRVDVAAIRTLAVP